MEKANKHPVLSSLVNNLLRITTVPMAVWSYNDADMLQSSSQDVKESTESIA